MTWNHLLLFTLRPPGPLTCYRNEATFCWRRFRTLFHTLDELKMKHKLWNAFQNDPIHLLYDFFLSNIMGAGTDKHLEMVPDLISGKFGGCFCLTEISQGSYTQSMRKQRLPT